ncbi:uncharacterized protein LOC105696343 [Orussus abietinus]|uniref:uncharacterized protein LOC105696343 n=1 Tax=Orussus abietinus TaxID=222816 RepID=UPI0006255FEA|nr:uncharacterized protein LOC105696343 [Orussus abietinus]
MTLLGHALRTAMFCLAVIETRTVTVPGKPMVLNQASMDVGNIISVVIPENPEDTINVDKLTQDFRRQLERIRKVNRASKVEQSLSTLKGVLPELSFEEKRKTLPVLRKVLRPRVKTANHYSRTAQGARSSKTQGGRNSQMNENGKNGFSSPNELVHRAYGVKRDMGTLIENRTDLGEDAKLNDVETEQLMPYYRVKSHHRPIVGSRMNNCTPRAVAIGRLASYVNSGKGYGMPETSNICSFKLSSKSQHGNPNLMAPVDDKDPLVEGNEMQDFSRPGKIQSTPAALCRHTKRKRMHPDLVDQSRYSQRMADFKNVKLFQVVNKPYGQVHRNLTPEVEEVVVGSDFLKKIIGDIKDGGILEEILKRVKMSKYRESGKRSDHEDAGRSDAEEVKLTQEKDLYKSRRFSDDRRSSLASDAADPFPATRKVARTIVGDQPGQSRALQDFPSNCSRGLDGQLDCKDMVDHIEERNGPFDEVPEEVGFGNNGSVLDRAPDRKTLLDVADFYGYVAEKMKNRDLDSTLRKPEMKTSRGCKRRARRSAEKLAKNSDQEKTKSSTRLAKLRKAFSFPFKKSLFKKKDFKLAADSGKSTDRSGRPGASFLEKSKKSRKRRSSDFRPNNTKSNELLNPVNAINYSLSFLPKNNTTNISVLATAEAINNSSIIGNVSMDVVKPAMTFNDSYLGKKFEEPSMDAITNFSDSDFPFPWNDSFRRDYFKNFQDSRGFHFPSFKNGSTFGTVEDSSMTENFEFPTQFFKEFGSWVANLVNSKRKSGETVSIHFDVNVTDGKSRGRISNTKHVDNSSPLSSSNFMNSDPIFNDREFIPRLPFDPPSDAIYTSNLNSWGSPINLSPTFHDNPRNSDAWSYVPHRMTPIGNIFKSLFNNNKPISRDFSFPSIDVPSDVATKHKKLSGIVGTPAKIADNFTGLTIFHNTSGVLLSQRDLRNNDSTGNVLNLTLLGSNNNTTDRGMEKNNSGINSNLGINYNISRINNEKMTENITTSENITKGVMKTDNSSIFHGTSISDNERVEGNSTGSTRLGISGNVTRDDNLMTADNTTRSDNAIKPDVASSDGLSINETAASRNGSIENDNVNDNATKHENTPRSNNLTTANGETNNERNENATKIDNSTIISIGTRRDTEIKGNVTRMDNLTKIDNSEANGNFSKSDSAIIGVKSHSKEIADYIRKLVSKMYANAERASEDNSSGTIHQPIYSLSREEISKGINETLFPLLDALKHSRGNSSS